MQTGWKAEENLIKQLLKYSTIRVKKYEISPQDGSVKLYFSEVI